MSGGGVGVGEGDWGRRKRSYNLEHSGMHKVLNLHMHKT